MLETVKEKSSEDRVRGMLAGLILVGGFVCGIKIIRRGQEVFFQNFNSPGVHSVIPVAWPYLWLSFGVLMFTIFIFTSIFPRHHADGGSGG